MAWTALLFIATIFNAVILWKTDHTLKDTLIANNRAWIWPDVEIAGDLDFSGQEMEFLVRLNNTGAAPATYVLSELFLEPRAPHARADDFCKKNFDNRPNTINSMFLGHALFPQKTIEKIQTADVWSDQIETAKKSIHYPGARLFFTLTVCISYRFDVDHGMHLTSRRFTLSDTDRPRTPTAAFDPRKRIIKREHLTLMEDITGSGFAN